MFFSVTVAYQTVVVKHTLEAVRRKPHLIYRLHVVLDHILKSSVPFNISRINMASMESLRTHPQNALQAKAFTSPASLSFPGGAGDLTPPTDDRNVNKAGPSGYTQDGSAPAGNVVTPATPAATPGAGAGVSGIVPTLQ